MKVGSPMNDGTTPRFARIERPQIGFCAGTPNMLSFNAKLPDGRMALGIVTGAYAVREQLGVLKARTLECLAHAYVDVARMSGAQIFPIGPLVTRERALQKIEEHAAAHPEEAAAVQAAIGDLQRGIDG